MVRITSLSSDLAASHHAAWVAPLAQGAVTPSPGNTSTLIQDAEETGVWYVGPWGDCQALCDPPVSTRTLECRSRIDHTVLNESACAMWGVVPRAVKDCSCPGVEICANSSLSCAPPQEAPVMPEEAPFVDLGCFPLKPRDRGAKPRCASTDDVYDLTCFNETDESCQSGFPFFRTCGTVPGPITPRECFDFCVARGLDMASIVQDKECRCGASDLASKVWRGRKHRNFFMRSTKANKKCPLRVLAYSGHYVSGTVPMEHCKPCLKDQAYMDSIVTHVLWPFQAEEDGVGEDDDARKATARRVATDEASTADTTKPACTGDRNTFWAGYGVCDTYASPLANHAWCAIDFDGSQNLLANQVCEECLQCETGPTGSPTLYPTRDPTAAPTPTPAPSPQPTPSTTLAPGWKRPCYPGNCGAGRGPWRVRQQEPPNGVGDKIWEQYTIIPYKFEDVGMLPVDADRKEVFRSAATEFPKHSCIVLQEVANTTELDDTGNYLSVQVANNETCSLIGGVGYGRNILNLGTCNSMVQRGNVVHEIGHAIGMKHEQQRQDASKTYHGYGPHLNVKWGIITDDWIAQYLPDDKAYIGSEVDGDRDPYTAGYMPYDFGSIMHYPVGNDGSFSAIDAPPQIVVGQRGGFSDGDILQMLDLYQCIREDGLTSAPTPAPVPPQGIIMTGFCGYQSQLEGKWDLQGMTQDTRPYYSKGGFYLYFDASCDGAGVGAMWILDSSAPAIDRTTDLDNDGSCTFFAYQFSWEFYPPAGTTTWYVWCGGTTFEDNQITVMDATPAPTLPPGATPSPTLPFPSLIRLAGFCPQQNLNVDYEIAGYTDSGMAYYREATGAYIYYDPACDGGSFESAWIIDVAPPDTQAQSDLDNDGSCSIIAWFPSPLERLPMGSTFAGTAYCGEIVGWSSVNVIFTDLSPTAAPTPGPTAVPTPTAAPTSTSSPTAVPSASPTMTPTPSPTAVPSASPTMAPTSSPTATPSASPTAAPTPSPTAVPSASPTMAPTPSPTAAPTGAPTPAPTTPPKVVVDVAVQGVNYTTLSSNQAALSAFTTEMRELFASLAGPSIEPSSVDIFIQEGEDERAPNWEEVRSSRQGSILVTGEIIVPDTGADAADQLDMAEDIQQTLQTANISEKTVEVIKQAAEEDPNLQSAVQTSQLQATSDVKVVTASPTAAPTAGPTSTGEDEASATDDPHVANLAGEHFDIAQIGEHLLLRVPLEPATPALLDVRGQVDADTVQACGTYIIMIHVSGLWMGNRTASVRPMKRSELGANNAYGTVVHNFTMRLSSPTTGGSLAWGPWRQVSELTAGAPEVLSANMNASGVLMREEFGDHAEAQAFRFEFGREKRATMLISQASHQALNVKLRRIAALGEDQLGGLLGTERHSTVVSELSEECKAYKAPQNSSLLRGIQAWRLSASWH